MMYIIHEVSNAVLIVYHILGIAFQESLTFQRNLLSRAFGIQVHELRISPLFPINLYVISNLVLFLFPANG
jgi:hypothetical protein